MTARTVDEQVAALLLDPAGDDRDRGVVHRRAARGAPDRACGLLGYVLGGIVAYANEAKAALAGVDPGADRPRTARCRSRSPRRWPTGRSRARRRRRGRHHRRRRARRRDARTSPSATSACRAARRTAGGSTATVQLPGGRADVRDRSTTVAMHLRPPAAARRGAERAPVAALTACGCSRPPSIPGAVRAALAAWGAAGAGDVPGAAGGPGGALHVTLVFLGSRDDAEAPRRSARCVAACADGPVELALGEPLWLSPRRPHVLTVAVRRPVRAPRGAAGARCRRPLEAGVGYEPERRRSRPHVTVARVRRGARVRPGDVALPRVPSAAFALAALDAVCARTPVRRRATRRSRGLAWSSAPTGAVTPWYARRRTGKRRLCADAPGVVRALDDQVR